MKLGGTGTDDENQKLAERSPQYTAISGVA